MNSSSRKPKASGPRPSGSVFRNEEGEVTSTKAWEPVTPLYQNVFIAQAGSSNFNFRELAWGFFAKSMPYLEFYTHE